MKVTRRTANILGELEVLAPRHVGVAIRYEWVWPLCINS